MINFLDLQGKISGLEVICPKHEAVIDARVKWYRRGLDNFKKCIPAIFETPPTNREHRVKGQIMSIYTMEWFLTRSHLHEQFVPFYKEVFTLCTRTMKAANKRGKTAFAKMLLDFRTQLENSVLGGRR